MWHKLLVILSITLFIQGCSSSGKEIPPAKLVDFNQEVKLNTVWSRSIGDGQGELYNRLTPAVDGAMIYAAGADGVVMAINRLTGDVKWKKKLKKPISGGVSASNGLVLMGTMKGEVIALDSATGDERWTAKVNSDVLSPPVTNGNEVIVQTGADSLFAFSIGTGAPLWRYDNTPAILTLRGKSTPLITQNMAIFGLSTGQVIALDVKQGIPIWTQVIAIPKGRSELERMVDINGKLVLQGKTLYVVTYQGQLAAVDIDSGRIIWQRGASSYTNLSNYLDNLYLSLADGAVQSINDTNSSERWMNSQLLRRQLSGPAVFNNYVAVGDFEGYLHVLSQTDGHFVARRKIDGDGLRVQPIVVDNMMYVYGNSGKLVALTIK